MTAVVFFLAFWAGIPWFRRNWIDEDAEEEDEQVSGDDPNRTDQVS